MKFKKKTGKGGGKGKLWTCFWDNSDRFLLFFTKLQTHIFRGRLTQIILNYILMLTEGICSISILKQAAGTGLMKVAEWIARTTVFH